MQKSWIPCGMVKIQSNISALMLLIIAAAILNGCNKSNFRLQPASPGNTFRFVFLADSRGDSLHEEVNTPALNAIISQIVKLSPKPSFVMFGGDMSYRGYDGTSYTFLAWKKLFTPLVDHGITLYTALGNHELYQQHAHSGYFLSNQQEFQNVFTDNPSNGPAGYDHLVYSFTDPVTGSFFAVLDPYFLTKDTIQFNLGGNINPAEMEWLKMQVAGTSAIHKFLFVHAPYYYISNDPNEPSEANKSFTGLWAFIDANKFDLYACGHQHLFSRRTIDSTIPAHPQTTPPTPAWKNNVVQVLNGTCGADPFTDTIVPDVRIPWNVHNDPKTYYFSVIDISGNTVTVNSYKGSTGKYTVFDTFKIVK